MSKSNKSAREELEIWKDIKEYEGLYQVSNLGKIRSIDRIIKDKTRERYQHLKGKELKFTDNGKGYKLVFLTKNSIKTNKYVHRLVAEAFIRNPNNLPEVNHKDLNKSNNCVTNLEWITNVDNKRHYQNTEIAKINNKKKGQRVSKKYNEKLKSLTPTIIYKYTKLNKTIAQINLETGIGNDKISKILKNNNISLNLKPRKKVFRKYNRKIIKRDKLGRFIKGGFSCE